MSIRFEKYQGLGNDFIIVETPELWSAQRVRQTCDRHRGVGADGVLFVDYLGVPGKPATPRMRVINSDGSQPEMCGNGLRCVVRYLADQGKVSGGRIIVETDAGPHTCTYDDQTVTVEMAVPSFDPSDIPTTSPTPLINHPLPPQWGLAPDIRMTALSMGNPHAVLFHVPEAAVENTAQAAATADLFPSGVNVGIANDSTENSLSLRVFERGVGWTQACGTGACAAAVAAVESRDYPRHQWISVLLPGGSLQIQVGMSSEPVQMRGPAEQVFSGTL